MNTVILEYIENTRFVFICNDCNKITEPIQSDNNIIRFPRLAKENLNEKIMKFVKKENIEYNKEGIESLLFVSDHDIRQVINNLECIYYLEKKLVNENIYKITDQPKPHYIGEIFNKCLEGDLKIALEKTRELEIKGYSPNDIILNMMKCLVESKLDIQEEIKLRIFEILSLTYMKVNDGSNTYLQIFGCLSKL